MSGPSRDVTVSFREALERDGDDRSALWGAFWSGRFTRVVYRDPTGGETRVENRELAWRIMQMAIDPAIPLIARDRPSHEAFAALAKLNPLDLDEDLGTWRTFLRLRVPRRELERWREQLAREPRPDVRKRVARVLDRALELSENNPHRSRKEIARTLGGIEGYSQSTVYKILRGQYRRFPGLQEWKRSRR